MPRLSKESDSFHQGFVTDTAESEVFFFGGVFFLGGWVFFFLFWFFFFVGVVGGFFGAFVPLWGWVFGLWRSPLPLPAGHPPASLLASVFSHEVIDELSPLPFAGPFWTKYPREVF